MNRKRGVSLFFDQVRLGLLITVILAAVILLLKWAGQAQIDLGQTSNAFDDDGTKRLEWWLLKELNHKTGTGSEAVMKLHGQEVRIPGFIVPLEDNQRQITEFLLVPSPQACIHVPPPPPNQMIYVKMKEPIAFEWGYRAYWIKGVLSIKNTESPYGVVSFEMMGHSVEPYNYRGN